MLTYNVYGGGVSLILSGDGEDIIIEGISENKYDGVVRFGESVGEAYTPANDGWETYTFYIKGNQYKDMSYNLTLWLGTGTAEENAKHKTTYTHYSSTSSSGTSRNTYTANGTFSSGWAFFDDLTMTTYPDSARSTRRARAHTRAATPPTATRTSQSGSTSPRRATSTPPPPIMRA